MTTSSLLLSLRTRWWVVVAFAVVGGALGALPSPKGVAEESRSTSYSAQHIMIVNNPELVAAQSTIISPSQLPLFAQTGAVPRLVAEAIGFTGDPALIAAQIVVRFEEATGALTFSTQQPTPELAVSVADGFAEETNRYITERQQQLFEDRKTSSLTRVEQLETQLDDIQRKLVADPLDAVLTAQRDALSRQYGIAFEQYEALAASPQLLTFTTIDTARATPLRESGLSVPDSRVARGILGAIVGGALGLGAAYAMSRIDRTIRSSEQAETVTQLRARVLIPKLRDVTRDRVVVTNERHDSLSDAYRTLRNVVSFLQAGLETGDDAKVTLVVSPGPGEGKTSLAINLAAALAETGARTIAVNSDFRRPQLTSRLIDGPVTQLPFILEDLDWLPPRRLLRDTPVEGLTVLDLHQLGTAGELARATAQLVPRLATDVDAIVIDTSPVGATAEVLEMAPLADIIVLVVRAGRTNVDAAERAVNVLRDVSTAPIVLVVTGVRHDRGHYYDSYGPNEHRRGSSSRSEAATLAGPPPVEQLAFDTAPPSGAMGTNGAKPPRSSLRP